MKMSRDGYLRLLGPVCAGGIAAVRAVSLWGGRRLGVMGIRWLELGYIGGRARKGFSQEELHRAQNFLQIRMRFAARTRRHSAFIHGWGAASARADRGACQRTTFIAGSREGRPGLHLQGGRHGICVDAEGTRRAAV